MHNKKKQNFTLYVVVSILHKDNYRVKTVLIQTFYIMKLQQNSVMTVLKFLLINQNILKCSSCAEMTLF
jgi:hypothetical protein